MSKIRIIGFAGRKRCGKTMLAKYMKEEYDANIVTIANYLKFLCCDLMNLTYDELLEKKDNGTTFDIVPDDRWFNTIHAKTNIPIESLKTELENVHITSIRQLLQVIGTDVIRKFNNNWHVDKMVEEILEYPDDKVVVIDDVRFPNEMEAIKKLGGEVFFIVRPICNNVSNHISETSLHWQDFDDKHVILNIANEDVFKTNFKSHYAFDFDIKINRSIFLYENEHLKKNANFGYKSNKDEDTLLNYIIENNVKEYIFMKYGVIVFKTCNKKLAERYVDEVDSTYQLTNEPCHRFETNNPLITENLKMYLEDGT